jgi:hypothetical protein
MSTKFYILSDHIWFLSESREIPSNQTTVDTILQAKYNIHKYYRGPVSTSISGEIQESSTGKSSNPDTINMCTSYWIVSQIVYGLGNTVCESIPDCQERVMFK